MAMEIGKSYESEKLRLRGWERYWEQIGFSKKQARRQTSEFADKLVAFLGEPENETQAAIQKILVSRIQILRRCIA